MRVSGGKARGVTLRVAKHALLRPATDRLRQGIFSSLGAAIEGAKACDLFAGSGSYGLEALSRGAASCCFVEQSKPACRLIKENLGIVAKSMGAKHLDAEVLPLDVRKWKPEDASFDFIFVDPPYKEIERLSEGLFSLFDSLLAPNGSVIFEMPGEMSLEIESWELVKRLGKGRQQATCCFFERKK